jgi:predicted transcriptional regulator
MNAVTFNIPDDIRKRIDKIAAEKGVTVEALLGEMTEHAVEQFEAHQRFLKMARQGEHEVEEALELLRRP